MGQEQPPQLYWNVPVAANPRFTGRAAQLVQLREALTSGARTQVVAGLGGVGKSQLASEYSHRHRDEYRIVCWLPSEEQSSIISGLIDLGTRLGLIPQSLADEQAAVESVLSRLQDEADWLLIFDNAEAPSSIRSFMPDAGSGHMLVTSQNPAWRSLVEPIGLEPLDRPDSVEFLCSRTGQADKAGASGLAPELGDLPLALEQAGAYIEQTGIDFNAYLQLFSSQRDDLWDREPTPRDHQASIRVTVELAKKRAAQIHPAASDLLDLLAYFAPDRIPLSIFDDAGTTYAPSLRDALTNTLARNDVVGALIRYSLVKREADDLTIHRLVQAAVRSNQTPDERQRWALAAVKVLVHAFLAKSDNTDNWPANEGLTPHILSVAERARELGARSVFLVTLLNNLAAYLNNRARQQEAQILIEQALEMNRAISEYPPANETEYETDLREQMAWSLPALLGQVLRDLDRFEEARVQLELSRNLVTERYGADDIRVARPIEILGTLAGTEGKLTLARGLLEQGLAIRRRVLGDRDRQVAITLNNLGTVLLKLGLYDQADVAYTEALSIVEEQDGAESLAAATALMNLGNLRHQKGDEAEAESLHQQALRITETRLGAEHPDLAIALTNSAIMHRGRGDLEQAEELARQALSIDEAALGRTHSVLARDLNNLAAVLIDQGRFEDAVPHIERALEIVVRVHGDASPQQVSQRANLAECFSGLGDNDRAAAELERCLELVEANLPPDHPSRAGILNDLAGARAEAGKVDEAVRLQEEAVAIYESVFGTSHSSTTAARRNLTKLMARRMDP